LPREERPKGSFEGEEDLGTAPLSGVSLGNFFGAGRDFAEGLFPGDVGGELFAGLGELDSCRCVLLGRDSVGGFAEDLLAWVRLGELFVATCKTLERKNLPLVSQRSFPTGSTRSFRSAWASARTAKRLEAGGELGAVEEGEGRRGGRGKEMVFQCSGSVEDFLARGG
jgi:hypothetical protein